MTYIFEESCSSNLFHEYEFPEKGAMRSKSIDVLVLLSGIFKRDQQCGNFPETSLTLVCFLKSVSYQFDNLVDKNWSIFYVYWSFVPIFTVFISFSVNCLANFCSFICLTLGCFLHILMHSILSRSAILNLGTKERLWESTSPIQINITTIYVCVSMYMEVCMGQYKCMCISICVCMHILMYMWQGSSFFWILKNIKF